jgi:histidinol-phosphatase (PHP family)
MLVDAHIHLQPHGQKPPVNRALLDRYVECARANGVDVIVITEHLFRFREAYALLDGWWDADPDPRLAALSRAYWQDEVALSLPDYVHLIETAKADGLPVRLGLEMDWIAGRAEDLRGLLAPYAWDCVLGSVHQLGAFQIDHEDFIDEWDRRDVAAVWNEYAHSIENLAGARLVDVIAHPDLPKVFGYRPADTALVHRRIVAAAARGGVALEINTNGLRKPANEMYPHPAVVRAARAAGVAVTLGSDAHTPERIGAAFLEAAMLARSAGYDTYVTYDQRRPQAVALPAAGHGAATAHAPGRSPIS